MQHTPTMHAARLKLERKALVALPPCCIAESLKNPKESDGDGWMDGVGRSKVHDPSRFVSPTAIVVFPVKQAKAIATLFDRLNILPSFLNR